jgi:hypothetical protein
MWICPSENDAGQQHLGQRCGLIGRRHQSLASLSGGLKALELKRVFIGLLLKTLRD